MDKDIYEHAPSLKEVNKKDIAIEINHLTKNYGHNRGVFDISFIVPKGKTMGYCGTNGAGKTTTLRHIMGFLKPDKGYVKVMGLDAWKKAEEVKKYVGYLPGEIAFPALETGTDFIKLQAEMLGLKDLSKAETIINALQLDPTANLKRMSKGMKQKTALVTAFMNSPDIIVLDEPTTGLDPLMREAFIELIEMEKERGATIIMSNHMFDELETCCDYVAFIKDGRIVDIVEMDLIHNRPYKTYAVTFKTKKAFKEVDTSNVEIVHKDEREKTYIIKLQTSQTDAMIKELVKYDIEAIHEMPYSLEQYFQENVIGGEVNESKAEYNEEK